MKFVEFPTSDGLTLPGLLFESGKKDKVVIYLHGNGSFSVFYDVADGMDLPNALNENGISLLKFNNRGAHIIKKLNVKKGDTVERLRYGCAYEVIKECVEDIEGAIEFLKKEGYKEFYLQGNSTGANKICVYNHYKPQNDISKYVLVSGGDDLGIYYTMLGEEKFFKVLNEAEGLVTRGHGDDLIKDLLPDEIFAYKGFWDIANPDGDYNCFPFMEEVEGVKLSTKPLFGYFSEIKKDSLVIYGELDEFAMGSGEKAVSVLKKYNTGLHYKTVSGADHQFSGKRADLAKVISEWLK